MSNTDEMIRAFIEFLGFNDVKVDESELTDTWLENCERARKRKKRTRQLWTIGISAAAFVAALIYIAIGNGNAPRTSDIELYTLQQRHTHDSLNSNIQLITSGGTVMNIGGAEANIDYSNTGHIVVDVDTITDNSDDTKPRYNQLIVPYGKRTHVNLSDGTRLCVNSGTKVVYPLRFGTGNREIYIEGEVYLEVAHDESRPFHVRTSQFDVTVLGTKFNVFAYPDADATHVVLVEGSVEVGMDSKKRLMKPGHLVETNGESLSTPRPVNVEEYISWVSNTLVFDNEPLAPVFARLHHYYGLDFEVNDDISHIYVSGKLYLQEESDDVLSSLSFSVPIECVRDDRTVIVKIKK